MLLPLLIIGVFRAEKIKVSRLLMYGIGMLVLAVALLPIIRGHRYAQFPVEDLVDRAFVMDLSRAPVLAQALQWSAPLDTEIVPYPGAGYLPSLLFYVPRELAPFKGYSTARRFTSKLIGVSLNEVHWNPGMGAISELVLNFGWLLCIPGLIVYGICMGFLDRLSLHIPSLVVPTRLGGLWVLFHALGALYIHFVSMGVVCVMLHLFFAERSPSPQARQPHAQRAHADV